ncbi:7-methylguanosine phosphate-specific 5'-nucleotidase isoform X2 [Sitophilus oryzae]|nr:7-methylguanosine phosphate-specific 5'-nucleotidase isoform X2 [Sitophilus oryzae]XP_030767268.1 7-methylguanosine phosphate-specific 5'-nucleotidase isoform X2 [Sitophilus oryzae]
MTMSIIQEISVLTKNHVKIKNPDRVNDILSNMIKGGVSKVQIVSDFDRTITKQHQDGVPHLSTFAMFSKIPSSANNENYQKTVSALRAKYYPIEIDPHIPHEEKLKLMEEWWELSEKAIRGLKVTPEEIEDICVKTQPSLREGTREFFKDLAQENVPIVVFSAGCGDLVMSILKQFDVYLPNVKIISNFLKYNSEGIIEGFQDKVIHVLNKNEYAIKNSDFYHVLEKRDNVIVLGDSLGDASMAEGLDHLKNLLKIGFLYDHIDQYLPLYLDTFDIVLIDDQTMDVPKAIFDYIKAAQ